MKYPLNEYVGGSMYTLDTKCKVLVVLVVVRKRMVDITGLLFLVQSLLYHHHPYHQVVQCCVVLYRDNYLIKQFLSHLYKLASLSFNNIIIILTRSQLLSKLYILLCVYSSNPNKYKWKGKGKGNCMIIYRYFFV